jgi:hypothetical protein
MRFLRPARSLGPEPASALLVLLRLIDVALPTRAKQHLRKWLAGAQSQAVGSELALSEALRVAMTEDVAQTIERAESYARLRDRYVERNPAVMGGEPVITGTRMPVRTIASLIEWARHTRHCARTTRPSRRRHPQSRCCGRTPTLVAAVPYARGTTLRAGPCPSVAPHEAREVLADVCLTPALVGHAHSHQMSS